MAAWTCELCSYVYDEEKESIAWADLPDDWVCPICGSPKSAFAPVETAAGAVAVPSASMQVGALTVTLAVLDRTVFPVRGSRMWE